MARVEFVWYGGVGEGHIPIPGLTSEIYGGENQPPVKVVVVKVTRLDRRRHRYLLSTSDLRMKARKERCNHSLRPDGQHGPDVCVKCNIRIPDKSKVTGS